MTLSCQYASHSSSGTSSKRAILRGADVVHEHVEPAERRRCFRDRALGLARTREIRGDVSGFSDFRRIVAPPARDDARTLGRELAYRLEPDPARRARHETPSAGESEVHPRG